MLRKTTIAAMALILAACAGCQTHEQNKLAAKQRWQKASAKIKLALAHQQYDEGRFDEAEKNIIECIKADPDLAEAHLIHGKLLLAKGQPQKALEQLQLAVELHNQLGEGWYWLGVAAQQLRRKEQAMTCYTKAMNLNPSNIDYILAVAQTYSELGKAEQALALLQEKMQTMPQEVSLKVAAADILFRLGRNEQAIDLYEQALLLTGDDSDIAESLGYCYLFADKWDRAAEIFENLAKQAQKTPRVDSNTPGQKEQQSKQFYLKMAALCSMKSGDYDRAVDCYGKLTVQYRDDAELWVKLGQAALGAGLYKRALACGNRAIALRPGFADAAALIGSAQYAGGNYAAALETFRKITNDKNNSAFAWLMIGRCWERLGRTNQAQKAYKKALRIKPNSELGRYLTDADLGSAG